MKNLIFLALIFLSLNSFAEETLRFDQPQVLSTCGNCHLPDIMEAELVELKGGILYYQRGETLVKSQFNIGKTIIAGEDPEASKDVLGEVIEFTITDGVLKGDYFTRFDLGPFLPMKFKAGSTILWKMTSEEGMK